MSIGVVVGELMAVADVGEFMGGGGAVGAGGYGEAAGGDCGGGVFGESC